MTNLVLHRDIVSNAIALPEPRVQISIRLASVADLAFIDQLQRKHARMVGWFPTKQLETNITRGHVLIAEEIYHGDHGDHGEGQNGFESVSSQPNSPSVSSVSSVVKIPVGYCISHDRYFKRDDCGIVYQLNVAPGKQRGLVGASLIKAVFDRAAYGCKLFSCWCAQDLEANHFWESIGFVPLAFRTGSRKAGGAGSKKEPRIHIFWQRRIREGDTETPYWFPSETTGGAIRENRIALPIPPGTHWSDAKPAVLPGMDEALKALPLPGAEVEKKPRGRKSKAPVVPVRPPSRGVWVAPPAPTKAELAAAKKAKKEKAPKFKNDPKLVAAARELRDRYIEQINAGLLLPPSANGKYDVSRQLEAAPSAMKVAPAVAMLEAA